MIVTLKHNLEHKFSSRCIFCYNSYNSLKLPHSVVSTIQKKSVMKTFKFENIHIAKKKKQNILKAITLKLISHENYNLITPVFGVIFDQEYPI